jgi:hypothetical protein
MLQQMLQRFLQHSGSSASFGRFTDGADQPRCRAPVVADLAMASGETPLV